ncbi:hypothetical protein UK15_18625 [Streptomyces variegatus]|uniref:Uncharacterized protein n=1 Tax=Streptomyces variegatus TaxID=284040 RepID=A0A0M2GS93_9ACTN|nr:hypothetical protein UK15_18625 [Streptomyces variegatus]
MEPVRSRRCEFGDDLPGGVEVREARFGLAEGGGEALDLVPTSPARVVAASWRGLKAGEEFGDVHAAAWGARARTDWAW